MKLNGMLSKIMDNYLCLRGIASIKELAKMSEANPDLQRDLLEEHKDEMKIFLEKGEYTFFPEVVLSMNIGLPGDIEAFETLVDDVDSVDKGLSRTAIGNVMVNFKPDNNKLIDERRQLKIAQLTFDENNVKLSRIDGNHRLSAAEYLTNDILIPFCIIIFPNDVEAENNSRAIFHNINSKQIPLELEQNVKIIIESSDVFTNNILEREQPFGLNYKFTRELLCGDSKIDFACFPFIQKFIHNNKYTFFTYLFRYLLTRSLIDKDTAVDKMKSELVNIENALSEANIKDSFNNSALIGALAYYKLSDNNKYNRFVQWIAKNHIADAKTVNIDDIISIFDKVYDNIPKKIFLARWYPASSSGENFENAQNRVCAIKNVAKELGIELIDIGTQDGGTFDIRSVMYNEIEECDIFIADLTGCRHNVMVEVGYALALYRNQKKPMLFYFAPTEEHTEPPFDLNGFRCEEINDSADIEKKVKPLLKSILDEM